MGLGRPLPMGYYSQQAGGTHSTGMFFVAYFLAPFILRYFDLGSVQRERY